MFAIGDTKIRPRVTNRFTPEEKMGIYFEVYNSAPAGKINYRILNKATGESAVDFTEEYSSVAGVTKLLPLRNFAPGDYELRVAINDGRTVERVSGFTIERR
jgi:hypothetical protein